MKGILPAAIIGAFALGCATAEFVPYVGKQQDWPTAPGALIEQTTYVPIYHGLPDRPYELIGQIEASVAPIRESGVLKYAAHRAKDHGADAIVVLERNRGQCPNLKTEPISGRRP